MGLKSLIGYFVGATLTMSLINACSAQPVSKCDTKLFSAADTALDNIDNWASVYIWYKNYSVCDDGYLSEGLSDTVGRLLDKNWSETTKFVEAARKDSKYLAFVLTHINSTLDSRVLESIHENTLNHCPKGYSDICQKIQVSADQALNSNQ